MSSSNTSNIERLEQKGHAAYTVILRGGGQGTQKLHQTQCPDLDLLMMFMSSNIMAEGCNMNMIGEL